MFVTAMFFMLVAGAVFAGVQADKQNDNAKVSVYMGTIIDNLCAAANEKNLGEFIKTHTEKCALMPKCEASGYSLYLPDGKLLRFDKAGSRKVAEYLKNNNFLKKKKRGLLVSVSVIAANSEFSIVSIKPHEPMNVSADQKPAAK
jgi:hypothetical protein